MPGNILSTRGLNTLMFSDPYAKLCFAAHLVSQFEKVTYIDLDTTFTAYFNAGLVRANKVDIYLPSEGRLVPMIKDALESMGESSLVIFDSVNSFYNLFPASEKTLGSLNHLLSILLMLLVRRGSEEGVPVLVTSMLRYRKDKGWVQSPASKRLLQTKSSVKMKIESSQPGRLTLTVLQHDRMPAGSKLTLENSAITA